MTKESSFDGGIILIDNAMLNVRPDLWDEWFFEKNSELELDIYKMTKGTRQVAWWICPKCDNPYDLPVKQRIAKQNCPYCSGKRVNHTNSLSSKRPDLAKEWHPTLNGDLTADNVTLGSNKLAWWLCLKCKSEYDFVICKRVESNSDCPYCYGRRVNHTNSLAALNPQLASEWHPTLNGELTPHDVTVGSGKNIWWQCPKDNSHVWKNKVDARNTGNNCHYCSGHKVLIGFNDMWTTNPEQAKLLVDPEDGYKYMRSSGKRVDWECPECGEIVKNKSINMVNKHRLSCPNCSDGVSFGEKVVYHLLKQFGIKFKYDSPLEWSDRKRYDFYLESYNLIIEVHGEQHYENTDRKGARNLKEEQENDRFKERLAKENGIEKYIVIDCRLSEIEWVKRSIANSLLVTLINTNYIDWNSIFEKTNTSISTIAYEMWNSGVRDTKKISEELNMNRTTIIKYLKRAGEIGLCDYDTKICLKENSGKRRSVVQLNLDGSLVRSYLSIQKAADKLGIKHSAGLTSSLKNNNRTAYGFKWMYKEVYDELIKKLS